jgi:hypothetical protein
VGQAAAEKGSTFGDNEPRGSRRQIAADGCRLRNGVNSFGRLLVHRLGPPVRKADGALLSGALSAVKSAIPTAMTELYLNFCPK